MVTAARRRLFYLGLFLAFLFVEVLIALFPGDPPLTPIITGDKKRPRVSWISGGAGLFLTMPGLSKRRGIL